MAGSRGQQYPAELWERGVRMVAESRADHGSEWEAMRSVASKLGIGTTERVRTVGAAGGDRRGRCQASGRG